MDTVCPKCGHQRVPTDTAPDWQCPRCHIAYAKFAPAASLAPAAPVASGYKPGLHYASSAGLGLLSGVGIAYLFDFLIGIIAGVALFFIYRWILSSSFGGDDRDGGFWSSISSSDSGSGDMGGGDGGGGGGGD